MHNTFLLRHNSLLLWNNAFNYGMDLNQRSHVCDTFTIPTNDSLCKNRIQRIFKSKCQILKDEMSQMT